MLEKLNKLNGMKIGRITITDGKRFVLSLSVLLMLVVVLTTTLIKVIGSEKDPMMVRITNPAIVGCYVMDHKLHDGTKVFRLTTPRGVEWCVGTESLQYSLDAYRASGEYGQPVKADK